MPIVDSKLVFKYIAQPTSTFLFSFVCIDAYHSTSMCINTDALYMVGIIDAYQSINKTVHKYRPQSNLQTYPRSFPSPLSCRKPFGS